MKKDNVWGERLSKTNNCAACEITFPPKTCDVLTDESGFMYCPICQDELTTVSIENLKFIADFKKAKKLKGIVYVPVS